MIGRDAAWFTPPDDPNEWLRDRSYDLSSELFGEGKSACTLDAALGSLREELSAVREVCGVPPPKAPLFLLRHAKPHEAC